MASTGVLTILGTLAVIVLGYLFSRVEQHLQTIATATLAIQNEIEAVRSGTDAMAADVTVLRNKSLERLL